MIKYVCNRCLHEIKHLEEDGRTIKYEIAGYTSQRIHLCKICLISLEQFLNINTQERSNED